MKSTSPRLLVALERSEVLDSLLEEALPGVPYAFAREVPPPSLRDVEALLVGSVERQLGAFDRSATPRLRFVQRAFTGLDTFPFSMFPPPIRVAGNVGGYAPFVAEGAVALALAAARSLVEADRRVREGRLRPTPEGVTLRGKTALVLGYGSIGREIAARLDGFGARVVGLNRTGRMAPGVAAMFPADRLREALAEADFVFEARPLTQATRCSIGAAELACLRPSAVLVNVGRAGTIDEEALFRHLKEHPDARAGLDVWWGEDYGTGTIAPHFPWADLPNLVGSPHSSSEVPEATAYGLARAIENVARFFRGEEPLFLANPDEYPAAAPARNENPSGAAPRAPASG
jgi:phosphoglycerate dehydrogenase-like enzyme